MDADALLERLQAGPHYRGQIAHCRELAARPARYAEPAAPLSPVLRALLNAIGIERLFAHQAQAVDAIRAGEHLVLCTGTASGKSLCYQVPVLECLLDDPDARALFLFPAKALAYDQLHALEQMLAKAKLNTAARPACYDGDTPAHKRAMIRREATLLLSNPDMLHTSILPYHAKWAGFFARVKFVVLDEIHIYRGIFGSHVACVIRRLQRICRHYGSDPQFICCSATLGNPRELAENLIQRPVRLIDDDASPRGRKRVVLWNPPLLEDATLTRRSANVEAQELMERMLREGAGVIAFSKARVGAELIFRYLLESLRRNAPELAARVRPYRGGYLPLERREIEQGLFRGEIRGVCSTNALELGIDIGSLDAAIVIGFPSTLCSLWQQAGRAGRRQDDSLAFFIAHADPIDQYLIHHPSFVFEKPLEAAVIDPQNPHILDRQLACAAFELPLTRKDLESFGETARDIAELHVQRDQLRETSQRYFWSSAEAPALKTNLRTISDRTFSIVDVTGSRNAVLGQVDAISAPELVYPNAIYLHQAESYIVRSLDWDAAVARVERFDGDYYTQPLLHSSMRIVRERGQAEFRGGRRCFGDVAVKWQTVGFRTYKYRTLELIGQTRLELPPQQIDTSGLWICPPPTALQSLGELGFKKYEALSGVRNLLLVALPPLAMADRHDVGGIVDSSQLGESAIFVYDRYAGGVGYARHGFEFCDELLAMARRIVDDCDCEHGCPACVSPPNLRVPIHHDPDLSHGYDIPDKRGAQALLRDWCGERAAGAG